MKASKELLAGKSGDAIILTFIKLVTIVLGLAVTRLLSEHLSKYDYGTYSQILLIVSTVTSLTILGMMDGVNYFFCSGENEEKREKYISTIFLLQCMVSAGSGCIIMLLSTPICIYMDNPGVKKLLIFAAVLPCFQNLLSMIQVLIVSIGKARLLAIRNLAVSILRLLIVMFVVTVVQNIAVILLATLLMDVAQITIFGIMLKQNGCHIRFRSMDLRMTKSILKYCIPMAVFTILSTVNRDCDKYVIAVMTNTETLAVYTNASKPLPMDIIAASFTTVLLPEFTRLISIKEYRKMTERYRTFLEIAYISMGILGCGVLTVSPQMMQLLYTEKYVSGLPVFCIYLMVDILKFTNMTLILSAAGKTSVLMKISILSAVGNLGLNLLMYQMLGITGPAIATLLVTLATGVAILLMSAKELDSKISSFFDRKYLVLFIAENLIAIWIWSRLQVFLSTLGLHYMLIIVASAGGYFTTMCLLNGKKFLSNVRQIGRWRSVS